MSYIANNSENKFLIANTSGIWRINDKDYKISTHESSNNIIVLQTPTGESIEAIIQDIDHNKKQVRILLNQKEHTIDILDPVDQTMLALGIDTKKLSKVKNIKAPMPGLILKTLVNENQAVKTGEALFILEAMKMENVFKAPDDLVIKKILIQEGDTVDKNQELITFA